MKSNILIVAIFSFLLISCSSDKGNGEALEKSPATAILGTWDATELRIDNDTASDDAKFAKGVLDLLTGDNCYIVTLQFNEDLTAMVTNSASYVVLDASGADFNIPCPTDSDIQSSTYTFDGTTVTTVDDTGEVLTIEVDIDGEVMTVDARDLEIPNFTDSGELVFIRR